MAKKQYKQSQGWVVYLGVGLMAGWLASQIVGGAGLLMYLVSGILGGFVGPIFLRLIGGEIKLGSRLITQIVVSALGAAIVVLLARLLF
jgi:uncharacterized membrane protein YeaQ/YmgE (transglycosylase-associated protein family)